MRRVLIVSMLLMILIAACAPEPAPTGAPADITDVPAEPTDSEDTTPESVPVGPAEETVIEQLAMNLGLDEEDITLVSSEVVEFSDA